MVNISNSQPMYRCVKGSDVKRCRDQPFTAVVTSEASLVASARPAIVFTGEIYEDAIVALCFNLCHSPCSI
jgi:hypothetical protein